MNAVSEALAAEVLDAWAAIAGPCEIRAWRLAPQPQRLMARTMAAMAIATGQAGQRDRQDVARALLAGFAKDCVDHGVPWRAWMTWAASGPSERAFWLLLADRFLARASALKAERRKAAA